MPRIAEINFLKNVPPLGEVSVRMDPVVTTVLHDIMLAEFFHLSQGIVNLPGPATNHGIYEQREAIVRVLDRLTTRPSRRGLSPMRIHNKRISVAEAEAIQCALKKLANSTDKELLKRLRITGSKLNVQVRRDAINALLKHVEVSCSNKIPTVSPEMFKGEDGVPNAPAVQ